MASTPLMDPSVDVEKNDPFIYRTAIPGKGNAFFDAARYNGHEALYLLKQSYKHTTTPSLLATHRCLANAAIPLHLGQAPSKITPTNGNEIVPESSFCFEYQPFRTTLPQVSTTVWFFAQQPSMGNPHGQSQDGLV
ncbi:hypothetical protein E1B28_012340 [Marasmius oreades]|uniref:Uncharacterized protein n=1 Tax=Marasmius oreades TaxID=181124 RepID=A0A9P7RSL9_9AGAR|nr:uncharacterized protein E1B28_012340 [Marasmius oreades]KAG7088333.1 hypothetical protein E1B28_012340 [Marasmius oreades]